MDAVLELVIACLTDGLGELFAEGLAHLISGWLVDVGRAAADLFKQL